MPQRPTEDCLTGTGNYDWRDPAILVIEDGEFVTEERFNNEKDNCSRFISSDTNENLFLDEFEQSGIF